MSDSMWKSYLDPQIAARNRWAVRDHALHDTLREPPRMRRAVAVRTGGEFRTRVAAVATALGALILGVAAVFALRIAPAGHEVLAPARSTVAIPSVGGTPAAPGSVPTRIGHAVAR